MSPTIPHDQSQPSDPGFDNATDPRHTAELDRITDLLAGGAITVSEAATRRYAARVALNARLNPGARPEPAPEDAPERQHLAEVAYIAGLLDEGRITPDQAEGLRAQARFAMDARIALSTTWTPGTPTFDVAAGVYIESLLPPEAPPFDLPKFVAGAHTDSLLTDSLLEMLELRIVALEEVAAARWPRRLVAAARLGRRLRRSVAPYRPVAPDFEGQRIEAAGDEWLDGRPVTGGTTARVADAAAVRADFERESYAYAMEGAERPDWVRWSQRLSLALGAVLDVMENDR